MKKLVECKECKGTGRWASTFSQGPEWFDCEECNGTGKVDPKTMKAPVERIPNPEANEIIFQLHAVQKLIQDYPRGLGLRDTMLADLDQLIEEFEKEKKHDD